MSQVKSCKNSFKAILAIDFDGTICDSEWPECGPEREMARHFINRLIKEGYGVVINTCREGTALARAIVWLNNHGINYHYVNCNFPHLIEEYGADCRKISADLYIDDKCLTGLPEWNEIYKLIQNKFNDGE
tara:strand:- start:16097 stop:16489 length:393 start_codon:yes stop_codon:yes gene_type:complete